jgi:predicted RNase H-like HicB family nuclease
MKYVIQCEQETDSRWIAEIADLPGVLVYGSTKEEAIAKVEALALRVVAEQIEHKEFVPDFSISFMML